MNKIFKRLIEQRGFSEEFLSPKYEKLANPFELPDMEAAILRIVAAISNEEKILIYGDYDVDGVTASTVLSDALSLAGAKDVDIMLPDRFADGYGMSPKIIERAKEKGVSLVVTVDCGSANAEIVEELKINGIDVVVTDHHECPDVLPDAVAVVNPKRKDYDGFRDLAGVGVAFKVAQGLVSRGKIPVGQEKWLLDLVLIGTICDNMPLNGENRILGFYGVKVLEKTRRPGLLELMHLANVKKINAETIGFQIGPRLNAAGRIESADLALDLLRVKTRAEAAGLAQKLEILNSERKEQQRAAVKEIDERGVSEEPVVIETGKWHEGILGIIAGRLVEKYHKPTFVLSEVTDGIFKGSGRSFGDFNLAEALDECRDLLINGGGHAGAAGVKLEREKLYAFRERMNEYYRSLNLIEQEKYLYVHEDLCVDDFDDLSMSLIEELKQLEPFGEGNTEPIFKLENVEIDEVRKMGADEQHLCLMVRDRNGNKMKLVAFYAPRKWLEIQNGDERNILIQVAENEWNGVCSVEGRIVDLF